MKPRTHLFVALGVVTFLNLLAPRPLSAQVDRSGIVGAVSDPSGALVGGAELTITNLATNQSMKATTDETGHYAANQHEGHRQFNTLHSGACVRLK
jgi:hypothetical protein